MCVLYVQCDGKQMVLRNDQRLLYRWKDGKVWHSNGVFLKINSTCRAQKLAKIEITLFPCGNCDLTHAQTGIPRDFDWSKNRI